ncbi:MAG TPA: ABC transporter permease [Anaerolineae bacterium]|nr:ABC transporter permease [Anaerolineae bacterium]
MRKVFIVARHEYLVNVRRVGFIVMTLLVPLMGAVGLFVAAFFGGEAASFLASTFVPEEGNIGIVDELGAFTPLLPQYEEQFTLYGDQDQGRAAVRDKVIASLLVIAEDYIDTGKVTIITREGGFSAAVLEDSDTMQAFFVDHLLQDEVDPKVRARVAHPIEPVLVSLEADLRLDRGPLAIVLDLIVPYFLGILLIMTIFVTSGYLLQGVAKEKTSRVMEIILSSVTAQELLAGKVLGLGALGLTQIVIWLGSSVALSGGTVGLLGIALPLLVRPQVLVLGVVYYILGFLVYAVLMGGVGALGTTQQESQQLAGIFSFLAAIPLMVGGFMFTNPNMAIVRVLSWFPLTAPTMMLLRMPMTEVPLVDVVGSLVMLILAIPVILWVGSKIFRMGLLMYGKRPSLRQIVRALRQA